MAKKKFSIIDDNGETMGFVVVEQSPTFQSTAPQQIPLDGPIPDVILLLASLGGFTATAYLIGGPAWLPPVVGISVTAILAGLKAARGSLINTEQKSDEVTIKVESWQDDGNVLLDEIRDKTIGLDDLRKVAKSIIVDGSNFSRPALTPRISQTTYHKIKAEFERLHFAHRTPGNKTILSPRAMAFLRKVNSLPR